MSTSILNSFTASGADITLVSRKLNVAITASTGTGSFPTLNYPNIVTAVVSPAVTETLYSTRVGWTSASSTVFGFTVNQMVNGLLLSKPAFYTSDSTATDTEIGTALAGMFANTSLGVTVTYVAANAYVTVTAVTGTPTFTISLGATGTMTQTSQMAGVAVASSTVANPSVLTSTAHGLVNGSVITLTSADNTKLASGTYVVQYLTANTYSLYDLSGNPLAGFTGTTTATVVKVAGAAVGFGTDLVAAGVPGASAGVGYAKYVFNYSLPSNTAPGATSVTTGYQHILYAKQWATTTTATYTTNFQAFATKMNEILSNYVAGGTIASHTALTDSVSINDVAVIV